MLFCTDSFINTMYSSAFFYHEVPYSRNLNVVLILYRKFCRDFDFYSLPASHIIKSGTPISFANYFIACITLDLYLIGVEYINPLSVTKI